MASTGTCVNAGDGAHAHPTQALLDLYTLIEEFGDLAGRTVAIVGDILHRRVAHSSIRGLRRLGATSCWSVRSAFCRRLRGRTACGRARLRRGPAAGRCDRAAAHPARTLRRDAVIGRRLRRAPISWTIAGWQAARRRRHHASRAVQPRHRAGRLRPRVRRLALRASRCTTASPCGWRCSDFLVNGRPIDDRSADPRRPRRRSRRARSTRCATCASATARSCEIGEHLEPSRRRGDRSMRPDAIVAPGFIDMHVHLREPGFAEKETIATGTRGGGARRIHRGRVHAEHRAGAGYSRGRCTSCWRDADARCARAASIRSARSRVGRARTSSRATSRALAQAGAVAFTDDGDTVMNARVLRDAALRPASVAARSSRTARTAAQGRRRHERGRGVARPRPAREPGPAEDVIVARDLLDRRGYRKAAGTSRTSRRTRRASNSLRSLRASGANATCEVTPHHLSLYRRRRRAALGAGAKVNPPLRTEGDVRALRDGVRDGTIDVFATDHAPHTPREKAQASERRAGRIYGLEIALGAYAAALPDLPLARFVELLSTNPARILGVPGGTLAVGAHRRRHDIRRAAVDRRRRGICIQREHARRSRARRLPRRALATIVGGGCMR